MSNPLQASSERLSLVALFWLLLRHWPLTIGFALLGAVLGVLGATLIKPVYRAEAVLVPVKTDGLTAGLGQLAAQFGGLASLAGFNLPGAQDRHEAIATLRSREIALKLIEEQKMLPKMFAEEWDPLAQRWRESAPTRGDALERFSKGMLVVREDGKTGLVTVGIEWRDRAEAAAWTNRIVELANEVSQARAVQEAERSIDHLQREARKADSVEIREAVFRLIESQLKNKTVAIVRRDYAFRVLDRALVPDPRRYVWPRKDVLGLAGLALGGMLGLALVWWRLRRQHARAGNGEPR